MIHPFVNQKSICVIQLRVNSEVGCYIHKWCPQNSVFEIWCLVSTWLGLAVQQPIEPDRMAVTSKAEHDFSFLWFVIQHVEPLNLLLQQSIGAKNNEYLSVHHYANLNLKVHPLEQTMTLVYCLNHLSLSNP